jgi:hypothetical protein
MKKYFRICDEMLLSDAYDAYAQRYIMKAPTQALLAEIAMRNPKA